MKPNNDLLKFRNAIDKLDNEIFRLLEKRFAIVKKVGEYKMQNNLPIRNVLREKEILEEKFKSTKLNKKFIQDFYRIIFKQSYDIEK